MLRLSGKVLYAREFQGKKGKFYRHYVFLPGSLDGRLLKVCAGQEYSEFVDVPVRLATDKFGPVFWVMEDGSNSD